MGGRIKRRKRTKNKTDVAQKITVRMTIRGVSPEEGSPFAASNPSNSHFGGVNRLFQANLQNIKI